MDSLLTVTKALSDENRVRALLALGDQEVCVCQLIELLQLAPSTVSKHMSILKQAGLVSGRKRGRWMYYRLPGKTAPEIVRLAIEMVRQAVSDAACIRRDAERMKTILGTQKELICERQSIQRRQKSVAQESSGIV